MKNEFATSIELLPVDREELAGVSGGLGESFALYVDGTYRGQIFLRLFSLR